MNIALVITGWVLLISLVVFSTYLRNLANDIKNLLDRFTVAQSKLPTEVQNSVIQTIRNSDALQSALMISMLKTIKESGLRIEDAAVIVAQDLKASHERADAINKDRPSGEA